jgi:hypothetical protein
MTFSFQLKVINMHRLTKQLRRYLTTILGLDFKSKYASTLYWSLHLQVGMIQVCR